MVTSMTATSKKLIDFDCLLLRHNIWGYMAENVIERLQRTQNDTLISTEDQQHVMVNDWLDIITNTLAGDITTRGVTSV